MNNYKNSLSVNVFVCTTPNHGHFVSAACRNVFPDIPARFILLEAKNKPHELPVLPDGYETIRIDFVPSCSDFQRKQLVSKLKQIIPEENATLWIPFYNNEAVIEFALVFKEAFSERPHNIRTYHEGLLSYTTERMLTCRDNIKYDFLCDFSRRGFMGIRELEIMFGRAPRDCCLSFDQLYEQDMGLPDNLPQFASAFIGQPLPDDGVMSGVNYFKIISELKSEGLIDVYIKHPRSTVVPNDIPVVSFNKALECYDWFLGDKTLVTLYSSAALYYGANRNNVNVVVVPDDMFFMNDVRLGLIRWMRNRFHTIDMTGRFTNKHAVIACCANRPRCV